MLASAVVRLAARGRGVVPMAVARGVTGVAVTPAAAVARAIGCTTSGSSVAAVAARYTGTTSTVLTGVGGVATRAGTAQRKRTTPRSAKKDAVEDSDIKLAAEAGAAYEAAQKSGLEALRSIVQKQVNDVELEGLKAALTGEAASLKLMPRYTMFQFMAFADKNPDNPVGKLLTEITNCGLDVALLGPGRGAGIERFMLTWMRLVIALRGGASTLSVAGLWRVKGLAAGSPLMAQLRLPSTLEDVAHAVEVGDVLELEVDTVNTFDSRDPSSCCDFAYVLYTPYGYAAMEALAAESTANAAAGATTNMKVAVVCVAAHASERCTPPSTFVFKKGELVRGTEPVAELARKLKLLKDRKPAIKAAVVKKSGGQLVEADVGVLYNYVLANQSLYATAGATPLTGMSTPEELAEYMREPKEGEGMARLSKEDVAVFLEVLCKHEDTLVVDGQRFVEALSPSLADRAAFVLLRAADTFPLV